VPKRQIHRIMLSLQCCRAVLKSGGLLQDPCRNFQDQVDKQQLRWWVAREPLLHLCSVYNISRRAELCYARRD